MSGMEWASIITAIGTIILGYFSYNQYTKNKLTDAKIKQIEDNAIKEKLEQSRERERRRDNAVIVYGELWQALFSMGADRVYIIQPHPLGREEMLSIRFEVKRREMVSMVPEVQKLKISEVANFSSKMVKNLFMYITDIEKQVDDKYARAIISSLGCQQAVIKRLSDNSHDWVGSIFCEFTKPMKISEEDAREIMHKAATNIQYIIPEIDF